MSTLKKKTSLNLILTILMTQYPTMAISGSQCSVNVASFGLMNYLFENYALCFDGENDYVEVSDSDMLDIVSEITVEFWLKFSALPDFWNGIITKWKWSSNGFPGYYIVTDKDTASVVFGIASNGGFGVEGGFSSMEVSINRWHYYAFTYDGSKISWFLDGRPHGYRSFAGFIGTNDLPLTIGCRSNKDCFFNGSIDEVRISRTARSVEEISSNYKIGKRLEVDENTVLLLHFDEGSGAIVHDGDQYPNDGILKPAYSIDSPAWIPSKDVRKKIVSLAVDYNNQIGTNNLTLGTHFDEWYEIPTKPELQSKANECHFGLVKVWLHDFEPCTYWNSETHTGTYDWTRLDKIIQTIKGIGATPLLCIGGGSSTGPEGYWLPVEMIGDCEGTGFPSNESFGIYCADIVYHVNIEKKWNVTYWEIWNEPSDVLTDEIKRADFTKTFNNAQEYIRNVDSNILCGSDRSAYKSFFDYFVDHAQGVGFLGFHKYDSWGTWFEDSSDGYSSDYHVLKRAGRIVDTGDYWWSQYSPIEMQQKWKEKRGESLPVICTETNLNSGWRNGTDPRIQQPIGAIWYAEELRFLIISNVTSAIYHTFTSDDSELWNTTKSTHGYGFGMVRLNHPYTEWYPYLVNHLIGSNLGLTDPLFMAVSNDTEIISVLAWEHENRYKLLLICKTDERVTVEIAGLPVNGVETYRIDSLNMCILSEVTFGHQIIMSGYTVLLVSMWS